MSLVHVQTYHLNIHELCITCEIDHRTRGVDRGNSGGGGQNHVLQAWQRQHHHIHSYSLQYGKTTIIILYGKLDIY